MRQLWLEFISERHAIGRLHALRDETESLLRTLAPEFDPTNPDRYQRTIDPTPYTDLFHSIEESAPTIGHIAVARITTDLERTKRITGATLWDIVDFTRRLGLTLEREIDNRESAQNFRIAILTSLLAIASTVLAFAGIALAAVSAIADFWSAFLK